MPKKTNLEQIEQLVEQLPPQQQLRMVANISHKLSEAILNLPLAEEERKKYAKKIAAFLRMSEELVAETVGEIDSSKDIREIREERASLL